MELPGFITGEPFDYDKFRRAAFRSLMEKMANEIEDKIMAIINIKAGDQYKDAAGNLYEVTSVFGGPGTPIDSQMVTLELREAVKWQLRSVQQDICIPAHRLIVRFQQVKPR